MGFAAARIDFDAFVKYGELPGHWTVTVTNRGGLAASYIPIEVMVESLHIDLESVSFTTEQNTHLQPGESVEYLLKLKQVGMDQLDGWSGKEIELSEKITFLVKYLGAGATTELFVVDLPL